MSSLILIVGSLEDAEDVEFKLNLSELYYETWDDDYDDLGKIIVNRVPVPIRFSSSDRFRIIQDKGSGKTLLAMHFFSEKVVYGGRVAANLGLVWDNEGKPKDDWLPAINNFDDFKSLSHCSVLVDDIRETIAAWNTTAASILTLVSGGGRKQGRDDYYTAQREKQIPPEIRDQATAWIVPIIRVRDNTRLSSDDHMGKPIEMIYLYFNGVKQLKYISEPIINLEPLFGCYSTTARAANLGAGSAEGARPNQPGFALESKAYEFLKDKVPGMSWQHLNGKSVFDIISDTHAIDVVGTDADGYLYLDHKDLLKHIRTAKRKCQKPYLMFEAGGEWRFMGINHNLNEFVEGKKINPDKMNKTRVRSISSI